MPGRHTHPFPQRLAHTLRWATLRMVTAGVDTADRTSRHVAPQVVERRERDGAREWNGPSPSSG